MNHAEAMIEAKRSGKPQRVTTGNSTRTVICPCGSMTGPNLLEPPTMPALELCSRCQKTQKETKS